MVKNAIRWATARGLVRTNEVHGAEEYKVPTEEAFLFRSSEKQSCMQEGSVEVQVRSAQKTL